MCFFLVMWLMGADEVTKEAIASYFNNPTAAWRPELKDNDTVPLGNQTGAGDTVLKGADGQVPDNLVQHPTPVIPPDNKAKIDADGALSAEEIAAADTLSFSFKETELFPQDGSADIARKRAGELMEKIGKVARSFGGQMVIRGAYDDGKDNAYELEMSRLVAVQRYVVERKWLGEDLIRTSLHKATEDSARHPSSDEGNGAAGHAAKDDRRIEVVFMK